MIGAVGGSGGLLLGAWAIPVLRAWLPDAFPRVHEVAFTWRSGAFAVIVALVAVLVATRARSGCHAGARGDRARDDAGVAPSGSGPRSW